MRDMAMTSGACTGNESPGPPLRKAMAPETAVPGARMAEKRASGAVPHTSRRGPLVVYLAALVTLAAIPIHLYWALGGTWGLPGGAAEAGLPGMRPTNAIVAVILVAGAALLTGLTRPWARRLPGPVKLTPIWLGSVVCVSHGLYGMATKGLYAAGAHSAVSFPEPLTAAQKNLAALHDLSVFEPWFLIQGLLLLLAGRWLAKTATGRRRWTLSLLAGIVLVDAFGIALTLTQQRLAIT